MTRLVFAVASHLHMTAGAVRQTMDAHELMCWAHLLSEANRPAAPAAPQALELSVEDEIAAWR
nr:hypothetical protein [Paraburkholderia sp. BL8N3]